MLVTFSPDLLKEAGKRAAGRELVGRLFPCEAGRHYGAGESGGGGTGWGGVCAEVAGGLGGA